MAELLVIGGGPGGVAAAQTAVRQGSAVTLVEQAAPGGTCVHAGCIPAGAYHRAVSVLDELERAEAIGVLARHDGIDLERVQGFVGRVVNRAAGLTRAALQSAGVEVIAAPARFTAAGRVECDGRVIEGVPVIVATGATSVVPDQPPVRGGTVLTNTDAMALHRIPDDIVVAGAGRFSLEWADFFAHLGAQVTVVSPAERVLPGEDADMAGFVQMILESRGVKFELGVAADHPLPDAGAVLFADSRSPNVAELGLETAGVETDSDGAVVVDGQCRTTAGGVFAAGDVTGPPWLSNRARAMGLVAATYALGGTCPYHPERLPRSVNTHPELAAVGMTEEQAAAAGIEAAVGYGELSTSLRGITLGEDQGALKLVVDTEFGEILGAHMVGVGATEVIAQVAAAMELEADYRDLARVQHLHPSLGELVTDAIATI